MNAMDMISYIMKDFRQEYSLVDGEKTITQIDNGQIMRNKENTFDVSTPFDSDD